MVRRPLVCAWALFLLALSSTSPLGVAADTGEVEIRPGMTIWVWPQGGCTANFVHKASLPDGDVAWFIGMAGHCVKPHLGVRASNPVFGEFGTVVYRYFVNGGPDPSLVGDFALVRIDEAFESRVNPAVCHWGGPTRHVEGIPAGDIMYLYNDNKDALDDGPEVRRTLYYGRGTMDDQALGPREGRLVTLSDLKFSLVGYGSAGDSGMPVIMENGAALGWVTGGLLPYQSGYRLDPELARAEAALGLDLELVTAPLKDPPSPDASCEDGGSELLRQG